jgi:opacity protein-like surface antigen
MRRVFAFAGAVTYLTIGSAFADSAVSYAGSQDGLGLAPGLGLARSETDPAPTASAGARSRGSDFTSGFRTEIERLDYSAAIPGVSGTPAGGVRSTSLMLNGLYEFSNGGWRLKPYIGVGFGTTDFSARLLGIADSSFIPTYQVKGGVNYNISQKLLGKLEYRWSQGNAPSLGISGVPAKFQLKRGGFLVGLNYRLQ